MSGGTAVVRLGAPPNGPNGHGSGETAHVVCVCVLINFKHNL